MKAVLLALLLSPNLFQDDATRPAAPPQARAEIERHQKTLESGDADYTSWEGAIERLAEYEYAEAVSALLKRLERNIAEQREQWPELICTITPDGRNASFIRPPENHLLVEALSRRKAKEALPGFSRMLLLDDKFRGMPADVLIGHINSIKRAKQ